MILGYDIIAFIFEKVFRLKNDASFSWILSWLFLFYTSWKRQKSFGFILGSFQRIWKENIGLKLLNINIFLEYVNPLRTSPTKWSNTLRQFVGKLPTTCLSVFGHFVGLELKQVKFLTESTSGNILYINIVFITESFFTSKEFHLE